MGKLLTQRGFTGMLGKAGALAQKMGLGPKDAPALASKSFDQYYSGTIPAEGPKRAKVAYFVGCGINFMYPDTGVAAVKVLVRNGVEVVIPKGQVCCGIPSISEGDLKSAEEMVRSNIRVFADLDVDAVITDCTSCGMMFKEKFVKLLPADDPLQEKAQALAAKVREVTDYLNSIGLASAPGTLSATYTYHVPCHRGWSPTVKQAPRQLLSQIPEAELREMEYPERCCWAAGTFFMEHRDLSTSIRSHKVDDIISNGADLVVTQCPVCRFYLSAGLKNQEVLHPVSLLARSYGL
jgi:glycolate oxidase iron-sulfur subunit